MKPSKKSVTRYLQDRIATLERNVEHWRALALAVASQDGSRSNTTVVDLTRNRELGLPPFAIVRFKLTCLGPIEAVGDLVVRGAKSQPDTVDVYVDPATGRLCIRARDRNLFVHPVATNEIEIEAQP